MTSPADIKPLDPDEIEALQTLIDGLPDTLEPLDVVMIDGYLCGVLLQPQPVPEARWLAHIPDVEGRAAPKRFDLVRMTQLVLRRHAELAFAISERDWFDPWVYELDDEASPSETVLPWVAGFATAVDLFTGLMDRHESDLLEPLATLYRHLDPDDLEDADELLAEIETLAPPETLSEAVEDLVRSVLLMADVVQPQDQAKPKSAAARGPRPSGRGAPSGAGARGGAPRAPGMGGGGGGTGGGGGGSRQPAAGPAGRPAPAGGAQRAPAGGAPRAPGAARPGGGGPRPSGAPRPGAAPRNGPAAKKRGPQ